MKMIYAVKFLAVYTYHVKNNLLFVGGNCFYQISHFRGKLGNINFPSELPDRMDWCKRKDKILWKSCVTLRQKPEPLMVQ